MTAFALLLIGAALAYGVAGWLKIPSPPLLVAAGVVLNASGALGETEMVSFILMLGVTVLVFIAGTELSPSRFAKQGMAALKIGLAQFAALSALGFGVSYLFGLSLAGAAYVALAIAASSTFLVVRILKSRRQFYEPFGRLVLGVLLVQDVLVILALAAVMHWDDGQLAIESALLRSVALLAIAWMMSRTFVPWLLTSAVDESEARLIVVLAILFAFIGAVYTLDVPIVIGAFCAGFAISPFPVNAIIRGQLTSFSDFFVTLFFTALGAMLVVPSPPAMLFAVILIAGVVILTPLLVAWFAQRSDMTATSSVESGLLLSQTSELSLVVVLLGAGSGHLPDEFLAAIALVTVITMLLTQLIATDRNVSRLLNLHPLTLRNQLDQYEIENHVVLFGAGRNTGELLVELLERDHDIIVVDHDPVVCSWAAKLGAHAVRADAAAPPVLRQVRAHHARVVITTLTRLSDNCRIVQELDGIPTLVRVYEAAEVEAIEEAGGIPIPYSEAATQDFLRWFDGQTDEQPPPHPDRH